FSPSIRRSLCGRRFLWRDTGSRRCFHPKTEREGRLLKILIIGAAGMVGRKLTEALVRSGTLGHRDISEIILADVVPAAVPQSDIAIRSLSVDMTRPEIAGQLLGSRPDLVFHLAAVVSGEAEADFEKGYRVNLDGMRYLLEAIRNVGQGTQYRPRLVF